MKRNIIAMMMLLAAVSPATAKSRKAKPKAPDAATLALIRRTQPWLDRVRQQPDWLVSRLQMYWTTHATDVYVSGEAFDHAGGRRAEVPTVKYVGTRGTASQYNRPSLADVVPYDDDSLGNVTYVSRATGKMEKAHPAKTGRNIAALNRQIMGIARDAAKIYAATADTAYGNMAARVLATYMRGIGHRNVPTDLNHGHQQTLVGMTEFEVIHEDIVNEVTEAYPLLKPLLKDEQPDIDAALKKWADNIIANGVPHNNWDLFQADLVMRIALTLGDDSSYADRRGRQYYLDYICHRDSIRQWSMDKLIGFGFDAKAKTWYESPGYSLAVLGTFAELANRLDRDAGVDLVAQHPVLWQSWMAVPQYLFPNRMPVGFGDTHPSYIGTGGIDQLMGYATRHGDKTLASRLTQLKDALAPDAPASDVERLASQVFYAPNVSWLALRTGMDRQHDLMASVNASLGNHQHANGISLELYGKGYVLGPDAGIGKTLYSGLDYSEYYSQMPAHNTVVVDGVSSYPAMMSQHAFSLVASSQPVSADSPSSGMMADGRDSVAWATVAFLEPETQARQQRTTVVVKTGDRGGFYIDVFRSRRSDGRDKTHDYFYHNLGQAMTLTALDGSPLPLRPTEELAFAGGHLYAYSYLYDKASASAEGGVRATFRTTIEDDKVSAAMGGQRDITMTMWMAPSGGRTAFRCLSPANLEYERMPLQPYKIADQPVLTFVARQEGEAWERPFVAVYEPSSDTEPGDIAAVDFFAPDEKGAVGIRVTLRDGSARGYVCHEDGRVTGDTK